MSESQLNLFFESDIIQWIRKKFGADADAVFVQLIDYCRECPDHAGAAIIRCIVHAACDSAGITHYIQMAREDYRDLIMIAEYQTRPGTKRWEDIKDRIHDFSLPFKDDEELYKKGV